jgi:putative transcriptional regulator
MKQGLFEDLIESVREGGAILRGQKKPSRSFEMDGPDVRRIRKSYDLSQHEFAAMLGISVGTLRNWEQGRRLPGGPARVLLRVAERQPEALWKAVSPVAGR